ncbi:MAG: DUF1330 domain-containing protein [Xanthobacteraceae bacterium]|jgi:uncharacterized protein (DUF1330 family)
MFIKFAVTISLLAIGGIGGAVLHAQTAAAPAYLIAHVQVTDAAGWKQYIAALPATMAPYHVKTLSRAQPVALDASTPPAGSTVILAFNSMDDLKAWWNSPAYQAIIPLREKSAKSVVYALPGLPASN